MGQKKLYVKLSTMFRTRSRRSLSTLSVCPFLLLLAASPYAQAPSQQSGVAHVPLPKLPTPAKKDRSGLPPVPVFKDIAKEVGLTVSHIAAPEAHYVIDSKVEERSTTVTTRPFLTSCR